MGLESFVYCLFRSQLAVAVATEAIQMICGIVRFEDQLQSMLKESIIAWLLSITVGDSCTEWVQNPNYRCLREHSAVMLELYCPLDHHRLVLSQGDALPL